MDDAGSGLRDATGKGRSWFAIPAALLTIVLILVLLEIGQQVLLPILLAVIAVYVLIETERFLASLPILGRMPRFILRLLVLVAFIALLAAFGLVIEGTLRQIAEAAPRYEANFQTMSPALPRSSASMARRSGRGSRRASARRSIWRRSWGSRCPRRAVSGCSCFSSASMPAS